MYHEIKIVFNFETSICKKVLQCKNKIQNLFYWVKQLFQDLDWFPRLQLQYNNQKAFMGMRFESSIVHFEWLQFLGENMLPRTQETMLWLYKDSALSKFRISQYQIGPDTTTHWFLIFIQNESFHSKYRIEEYLILL